jgi:deoxyuridine 5'-triphosphate nucleotidohydrolase
MLFLPKLIFKPTNLLENHDKELAYQTEESGCFDVYSDEPLPIEMQPHSHYAFKTGMYLDQEDTEYISGDFNDMFTAVLVIRPRSGLAYKYAIDVLAGEIDLDYKQEIKAILINHGYDPIVFAPGERICQARWTLCLKAPGVKTLQVERTGGFGSTNV